MRLLSTLFRPPFRWEGTFEARKAGSGESSVLLDAWLRPGRVPGCGGAKCSRLLAAFLFCDPRAKKKSLSPFVKQDAEARGGLVTWCGQGQGA